MVHLFILLFTPLVFFGCGESNSSLVQEEKTSFYISKAPLSTEPVSINQVFVLEFSVALEHSSINNQTIFLVNEFNQVVGSYIGIDDTNKIISITPYQYLTPDKKYEIVVTTQLKDSRGNSLSKEYRDSFITKKESVDNSSLVLKATKPVKDATDVLVQTEIAFNFNKSLSLEPAYSTDNIVEVKDENGTIITGKVDIFNSVLKFSPTKPLPFNSKIDVTLKTPISDIYGNDYVTSTQYSFRTRTEQTSLKANYGFKPLTSLSLGKTATFVRTIYNKTDESQIVVVNENNLDIYLVKYGAQPGVPSFEYKYTHKLGSVIKAVTVYKDKYLLVGTVNDGVYYLEILPSSLNLKANYLTSQGVYGLNLGVDANGVVDRVYAVGPEFGLQLFSVDSVTDDLKINTSLSAQSIGVALDVVEINRYELKFNEYRRKVYVADYNGSVVVYDENLTFIERKDMNGSVKRLATINNYGSGIGSFLAIDSSGHVAGYDFSDGIDFQIDLISSMNDVNSYYDTVDYFSTVYYAQGDKGMVLVNGFYPQYLLDTNGSSVSSSVVSGYSSNSTFLVTLNSDGRLQIFNAQFDNINPSYYSNPRDGDSVFIKNFKVTIDFYDKYLDSSTIDKNTFSFKNDTDSVLVDFNISVTNSSYTITPLKNLVSGNKYTIGIAGTVSDVVGNNLNNGANQSFSFSAK